MYRAVTAILKARMKTKLPQVANLHSRTPSKQIVHQERIMKRLQTLVAATALTFSISTATWAGTITGSRTNSVGTITGSSVGTITGSKAGTITGSKTGTITGSQAGTITGSRAMGDDLYGIVFTRIMMLMLNLAR